MRMMRPLQARIAVSVIALLVVLATVASADMTLPVLQKSELTGSWEQGWIWGGFDAFAVRYVSGTGGPFEHPALRVWESVGSGAGWEVLLDTPTLASAKGPYADWDLWFTIYGAGDSWENTVYDIATFHDEVFKFNIRWDGSGWTNSDWQPSYSSVVPLPGAILFGVLGLGAAGLKLRRYR